MPTYYDEKTKTWYCKFYYTDYTGNRKQKKKRGFKLQRDAKEWERTFLEQQQGRPDMLFTSLYALYMEDMGHRLRITTMANKSHLIETKLIPYFGKLSINEIQASTIRKWQNEMTAYRDQFGNPYANTYLKAMNNQLSALLNYAVKYYHLSSNPCHAAGSIGKKQASEMQFWTPEEFFKFWNTFPRTSEMSLIFSILYYTGMRIGEVLALTENDFDALSGIITVDKSFHRFKKEDIITPPKTPKSNRKIVLPDFLRKSLQKYIKQLPVESRGQRLFSYSKHAIYGALNKGCRLSGIKKIRVHDLRHSHASLLIEMGISPILIADRLGHENIETTLNTYSHLYPNKQTEIANKLQDLYNIYKKK